MSKQSAIVKVMIFACAIFVAASPAAQDSAKVTSKKTSAPVTVTQPVHEVTGPAVVSGDTSSSHPAQQGKPQLVIKKSEEPKATAPSVSEDTGKAVVPTQQSPNVATVNPPQYVLQKKEELNTVDKMRNEAARLRAEAKTLRELSDTLDRASNEAEDKADDAMDKAEKIEDEVREAESHHIAQHIKKDVERIKRLIAADVERIKKLHGISGTGDTAYSVESDSLDSLLAKVPADTNPTLDKQKQLLNDIQQNSKALLDKSKEMSAKAREMQEAAEDREEQADDLLHKASKLAEDQNTTPLSKRFPLHVGFTLRVAQVKPYDDNELDALLFHGIYATYSLSPAIELGLQDVTLYTQQTLYGTRFAITAAPAFRYSHFITKRFQVGAALGASVQGRVGCDRPAKLGVSPYVALTNEFWVRNHFSIVPTLRFNYAAYGPYYATALSEHSGVLPEGACWMDFGVGYTFNF